MIDLDEVPTITCARETVSKYSRGFDILALSQDVGHELGANTYEHCGPESKILINNLWITIYEFDATVRLKVHNLEFNITRFTFEEIIVTIKALLR